MAAAAGFATPATTAALNLSAPLAAAKSGYATPQAPASPVAAAAATPAKPVLATNPTALLKPAAPAKMAAGPNLTGTYAKIGESRQAAQTANGAPQAVSQSGAPHGIVGAARTMLGVPYVWGGTNTKTGLDCSAFVQAAYAKVGIEIPRTTYQQFKTGKAVALNQLQPGDAVYVEPEQNGPGHVGLYIGNGQIQESPHTGSTNRIVPLTAFLKDGYVGSRRF